MKNTVAGSDATILILAMRFCDFEQNDVILDLHSVSRRWFEAA